MKHILTTASLLFILLNPLNSWACGTPDSTTEVMSLRPGVGVDDILRQAVEQEEAEAAARGGAGGDTPPPVLPTDLPSAVLDDAAIAAALVAAGALSASVAGTTGTGEHPGFISQAELFARADRGRRSSLGGDCKDFSEMTDGISPQSGHPHDDD